MFIQIQSGSDQKRHIILHRHVNGILQRVDGQKLRVGVRSPVHCIVQLQQFSSVAEQHGEDTGLVLAVDRAALGRHGSYHRQNLLFEVAQEISGNYPSTQDINGRDPMEYALKSGSAVLRNLTADLIEMEKH